jgi:hypothetical protein
MTAAQKQRVASLARQIGAGLLSLYGILSIKDVAPHLPAWCNAILVAAGPLMQLLEHSTLSPTPVIPPSTVPNTGVTVADLVDSYKAPTVDINGMPAQTPIANPAPPAPTT